jgi:hypothetical protein
LSAKKEPAAKPSKKQPAAKPSAPTVTHKAPAAKPKHAAPALNLRAIEASRNPKAATRTAPGALDLRNTSPKPAAKKPIGKHVSPKPKAPVVPVAPVAEPVISEAPITEVRVPVPAKKFRHKLALREALKGVFGGKALTTALFATLAITVCQVIYATIFAKTGLYAITESISAGSVNTARATTLVGHLAWGVLISLAGYVVYQYSLAKIIYRGSTEYDRLNSAPSHVRHIAAGSIFGLVSLDVISYFLALSIVLATAGANLGFLGTKSLGVAGVVLAAVVNIIAVYILLGLIVARQMAMYAAVMGQVSVRRAYSTGWALYTRQFGRTTSGLLLMLVVSLLLTVPLTLLVAILGTGSTLAIAVTVALAVLTQAVVTVVATLYFVRLYQFVLSQEYDSELGHLLSGRQPHKAHVGRRLIALAGLLLILTAAMTSLIAYASPVASALIR